VAGGCLSLVGGKREAMQISISGTNKRGGEDGDNGDDSRRLMADRHVLSAAAIEAKAGHWTANVPNPKP